VVRIAATADLHYGRYSPGTWRDLAAGAAAEADVLLICGDLTDDGRPDEARALGRELTQSASIPIVAVLGNHDYESGQVPDLRSALAELGIVVLDGESCEVRGVGFAGTKGFGGGFGARALSAWGEPAVKHFVQEAVAEALKLETALSRLRTPTKVAILHYSPVRSTVEGEAEDILPFLGSSRLEEPLNRYGVTAVCHGHAHGGRPEGRTSTGAPVYNVSLPVIARADPSRRFRVIEVETTLSGPVADA
jgi:Icc-related predicted phosphoesterase